MAEAEGINNHDGNVRPKVEHYDTLEASPAGSTLKGNGHSVTQNPIATGKPAIGSPTGLGIGAFSTTLTTLSFVLMDWRGLATSNVLIANFFFTAGVGMVITAQWEIALGNSFAYVALSAYGLFYAGYGAIITPAFGVKESYGDDVAGYNNALGFWVLMWAVWSLFFVVASLPINFVFIGIFAFVDLAFILISAAYFALADGNDAGSAALLKAGGAFAFIAGLLGYYTVGNLTCQQATGFSWPMGDTSRFFKRTNRREG